MSFTVAGCVNDAVMSSDRVLRRRKITNMTLLWLIDAAELGSVLANETSYFYVVFVTSDCVTCLDLLICCLRTLGSSSGQD